MREFKVADKVVLRPETKPYTFRSHTGNQKVIDGFNDQEVYKVSHKYDDGDVDISAIDSSFIESISSHHLTHIKEEFNEHLYELRLDIFKTNPSLSVSEMQEIEKWLLNK